MARIVRFSAAVSLDGYIAGPKGEADWIVMDPDIDFNALFSRYDTVLMGRKSFQAAGEQAGMPGMEAYVFTKTLPPGERRGVTLSSDPQEVVRALKSKPGKDIWLFGGGELLRSLLEMRLVDAIEVAIVPVLLGGGIPLLPAPAQLAQLKLTKHRVYQKTGTILLEYDVAAPKKKRTRA